MVLVFYLLFGMVVWVLIIQSYMLVQLQNIRDDIRGLRRDAGLNQKFWERSN